MSAPPHTAATDGLNEKDKAMTVKRGGRALWPRLTTAPFLHAISQVRGHMMWSGHIWSVTRL